jgi:LysR family glycine cleavage system transcriptional activator
MRKLPPLNAIKAFEAAARHVSFTKAADELHVTHGAVSRQVALLEQWFGSALFKRSASQLTLTETGRSLLVESTTALDRLALISGSLLERSAPTALWVNAPPTFTMRWLIPRLSTFQRRHPDAEIRLSTSIAPVSSLETKYDVAIRGLREADTDCAPLLLMTELIVPVCHVDLLERRPLRSAADLEHHTLIAYATEPYSWSHWLTESGLDSLRPAGTLRFEQMFFALQAATEGLGVALVPLFLVIDDLISGRLCAPLGLLGASRRAYYASIPAHAPPSALRSAFSDWLVQEGKSTEANTIEWAKEQGWAF